MKKFVLCAAAIASIAAFAAPAGASEDDPLIDPIYVDGTKVTDPVYLDTTALPDESYGRCQVTDTRDVGVSVPPVITTTAAPFQLQAVGRGPDPLGTLTRIECSLHKYSPTNPRSGEVIWGSAPGPVAGFSTAFEILDAPTGTNWYVCGRTISQPSGLATSLGCNLALTW